MKERRKPERVGQSQELTALLDRVHQSTRPVCARIVGVPYYVQLEQSDREENVDHVWYTLEAPPYGKVRLSVNFLSKLNADAGFDGRVRVAVLTSHYTEKPESIVEPDSILDYRTLEVAHPELDFNPVEPADLARTLMEKGQKSCRIEAWGELYRWGGLGLHQIHSQRASCVVLRDILGRDGGIRFYLPDGVAELHLLKYCGQ